MNPQDPDHYVGPPDATASALIDLAIHAKKPENRRHYNRKLIEHYVKTGMCQNVCLAAWTLERL